MGRQNIPLRKLNGQISNILLLNSVLALLTAPAVITTCILVFDIDPLLSVIAGLVLALIIILINTYLLSRQIMKPFGAIEQALQYINPNDTKTPPPDPKSVSLGKEVVTDIIERIYKLLNQVGKAHRPVKNDARDKIEAQLLNKFNYPVLALDRDGNILYANANALALLDKPPKEIIGKSIETVVPLRYENSSPILPWLENCKQNKIKDDKWWFGVKFTSPQRREYSYDVYAHYNRDDPSEADVSLMLIDRTSEHEFDDMKVDFVALAAHELRAPITVIRGYMEVFEDEVGESLSEEHREFLTKMKVSSAQLAGFITNILDASRADRGRLNLSFNRTQWSDVLQDAIEDLSLQAEALGRKIELTIDDNLPEVVIDNVSIVEVINNLVDNAIKYSPQGSVIKVSSKLGDRGGIQTDIVDQGIGIPANLMDKLFTKFYRSHRSRQQFSGTGLGLYLSKSIIETHRGNIWANSKEEKGSTFSFWLPTADDVAKELTGTDNKDDGITRGSHGWIKNHSMYRR